MSPPLRPLPADEVHVWAATLGAAPEGAERILSADERERAARFRSALDRDRYTAARCMLRRVLGEYLGCPAAEVRLRYGETGKPALDEPFAASGIDFNLSHTGDRVLLAVARGRRVGVDVERVRAVPHADRVARRVFPPSEYASWLDLPPEAREAGFVARWSRLEAVVKLQGEGVWRMARRDPAEEGITVRDLDGPPGCVAAVAAEGAGWVVVESGKC